MIKIKKIFKSFYKKHEKLSLFFLLLTSLLFAVSLVFIVSDFDKAKTDSKYYVVLRPDGFHPKELVVPKGATVVFSSENELFWPASSPHPEHTDYAAFDPKRPLEHSETWEFVFDKIGTWLYHDHIQHGRVGRVTVVENLDTDALIASAKTDCLELPEEQKLGCWDSQLEKVLVSAGLDAAFNAFQEIYTTEPDVPKACHEWGHVLGEAAFDLYKVGKDISFRKEMGYCGYGFFHGFLEGMTAYTGDVTEASRWCQSLIKNLENNQGPWKNCVHGVGHGSTAWLLENKHNWGNFQKVADLGLDLCEKAFEEGDLVDCYDGVFNELHLELLNSEYQLNFRDFVAKNDPYYYCRGQQDRHKESCYFEFAGIFYKLFDFDLQAATDYVVKNTEDLDRRGPRVIAKLAADFMQFDIVNSDYKNNIQVCRTVPNKLFEHCLNGIINGFIQHGEPENLHTRSLAFCKADYLTENERKSCHHTLLGYLRWHYTVDKMKEVCGLVGKEYKEECLPHELKSI
ncbi:MAG TPA: hypothetical protein VD998_01795 [Verrucomicrobiae bacterium]|nr:hypothetical protein [Verrucomicrobiae bacterium]